MAFYESQAHAALNYRWDRAVVALEELKREVAEHCAAVSRGTPVRLEPLERAERFLHAALTREAWQVIEEQRRSPRLLVRQVYNRLRVSDGKSEETLRQAASAIRYEPPENVIEGVFVRWHTEGPWKAAQQLVGAKLGRSLRSVQKLVKQRDPSPFKGIGDMSQDDST